MGKKEKNSLEKRNQDIEGKKAQKAEKPKEREERCG